MEKFRRFADEATGNNPFLKHPDNKPSDAAKLLYYVRLDDSRLSDCCCWPSGFPSLSL